ncbi:hypothetical protein GCM10010191_74000 [Actinomadura vinacea]|uniref:Coenzyme PQQ synthesis protein A n=1 Tax=Actinomadura vinacea TaxID=115336 RepID=A0ABP5X5U2_9ACTN
MHEQTPDTERRDKAADQATTWVKPDYEVIETSLEVTAYFGAES